MNYRVFWGRNIHGQLIKSPELQVSSDRINESLSTKKKTRLMRDQNGCCSRRESLKEKKGAQCWVWLAKSIHVIDQVSINETKPVGIPPSFYRLMNSTALWISSVLTLNPSHPRLEIWCLSRETTKIWRCWAFLQKRMFCLPTNHQEKAEL